MDTMDKDYEWKLVAPRDSLTSDPQSASLVLRMGAAINSLRAAQHWYMALSDAPGVDGQRNRTMAFLTTVAFLKESIDGLVRPYYQEITSLAINGGADESEILALGNLTSTKPQSLYSRMLMDTRNQLVFHWSEDPFRKWAESFTAGEVEWACGVGPKEGRVVHSSASTVVLEFMLPGASHDEIKRRIGEVADASGILATLFQKAAVGYLDTHGASFVRTLTGVVSSRFRAASPNLKSIEALLLKRTGLPSMAPGTLNVKLPFSYIVRADYTIERREYFTGELLKLQRCCVRGHRMIIMRPDSHELPGGIGADVIELVSPIHLRDTWSLTDGDQIQIDVEGDDAWWERAAV
jgi:hypothetical protein